MGTAKVDTKTRRRQIAEVALTLVANEGMRALSVAKIARHVGIVPSAIYRHFEGKEAVLDEVIELIGDKLAENVQVVKGESKDAVEQLYRLLMRHTQLVRENRGIPRIVFSEDVYSGNPTRKARIYAIIGGYLDDVARIVGEGQKAGCIRKDVEPSTVAVVFLGLIQPAAVLWHLSEGQFDVTKQARKAWDIIKEAIST